MEFVKLDREGSVAVITIERPKALNALNRRVIEELSSVVDQVIYDPEIRAAILTGSGQKAFVAGADIKELAELDPVAGKDLAQRGQEVFQRIEDSPKPFIAAVNGFALGGGCELALSCAFRIASANAQLGLPEVTLGLIPGYGGTQRLARLVGKGRALELTLTGQFISAERASSMGLVNDVVEQENLLEVCMKKAKKIAKNAPIAIGYAIEAVNKGLEMNQADGLALEASLFGLLNGTEDAGEGLTAFIEKRKAEFKGK